MNALKYLIALLLTSTMLLGQIPKTVFYDSPEDENFFTKDFTSNLQPLKNRIAVYELGYSEWEWSLVFLLNNDSIYIQARYGKWIENGKKWLNECKTFNNVKLRNNKFYFGDYSGMFVEYNHENKIENAILLYGNPTTQIHYGKDSAEIGFFYMPTEKYFQDGKYSLLSRGVQADSFFARKPKEELRLMRNEIYARYGLIFKSGGEMDKYFRTQDWYNPFLVDVTDYLTEIEKRNIQKILKFEGLYQEQSR